MKQVAQPCCAHILFTDNAGTASPDLTWSRAGFP